MHIEWLMSKEFIETVQFYQTQTNILAAAFINYDFKSDKKHFSQHLLKFFKISLSQFQQTFHFFTFDPSFKRCPLNIFIFTLWPCHDTSFSHISCLCSSFLEALIYDVSYLNFYCSLYAVIIKLSSYIDFCFTLKSHKRINLFQLNNSNYVNANKALGFNDLITSIINDCNGH